MGTWTCSVHPTPERELELERLGNEIAELAAHLDAATARLLDLIRDFDTRGGWGNGFSSCAAWLTWRIGLSPGAAREHVRVARALGTLPRLAQALARGKLSYSKVRALTRVATPETEERLLAFGRAGTAEHVERIIRAWRYVDRKAEIRDTAKRHARRVLHLYPDDDGMVVIRGRLEPEVGAVLMKALEAARETLYQQGRRNGGPADVPAGTPIAAPAGTSTNVPAGTWARRVPEEVPLFEQQQADALALIAETALHHGMNPGAPAERYQVVVHVDAAVLADADAAGQSLLEGGARVPAETSQRLACDASRVVMRHDADGQIVEVGARTRTIPPALRRALHHRDRGCRFPGCGVRFGQGHHIRHWAHGGPTTLSNLMMLCRRPIAPSTKRVITSTEALTASSRFDGRTAGCYPRSRHRLRWQRSRSMTFEHRMRASGSASTGRRQSRAGWASDWTSAMRSTSCIRWHWPLASRGDRRMNPGYRRPLVEPPPRGP